MPANLTASFNIPTHDQDIEGMRVSAMVMPALENKQHGFISLPANVDSENVEALITAIRACQASLEDNCHNHPTQPMREIS